jgi:uncharacterized protein YjbI with pentapeptide repeats
VTPTPVATTVAVVTAPKACTPIGPGANLKGCDLHGADLSAADLEGANLTGANLTGANLSGADLVTANLNKANLTYAFLNTAYMSKANLRGADLSDAKVVNLDLTGAFLQSANLTGADLTGTTLNNAFLQSARLTNANLRGAYMYKADLSGTILNNADLTNADLSSSDLSDATLTAAILSRANLTGADLSYSDLSYANLFQANLTGATLGWANLTGARLNNAILNNAILNSANLTGASLTGATLTGANLTGANLTGANLTGATWTDAICQNGEKATGNPAACYAPVATTTPVDCTKFKIGADLEGCDLSDKDVTYRKLTSANLKNVNLTGADLTGTLLVDADLTGVTWTGATCPSGEKATGSPADCLAPAKTWDTLYWTNAKAGNKFDWVLPPTTQLKSMVVAPVAATVTKQGSCKSWPAKPSTNGLPGAVAQSALVKWIAAGFAPANFEIWMRGIDGAAGNPTQATIDEFDRCVAAEGFDFSKVKDGGKAQGVLCILDSGDTNTCSVPPPSGYKYGVMRGPQMMGTDAQNSGPNYEYKKVRALATHHFAEMYEPGYYGVAKTCPANPTDYGVQIGFYIAGNGNSRGATNSVPFLGGNAAKCPTAHGDLPAVMAAMGSPFYNSVGIWSSGSTLQGE